MKLFITSSVISVFAAFWLTISGQTSASVSYDNLQFNFYLTSIEAQVTKN
jgi:hypothetical protein